jgi:hypothetical protein
MQCRKPGAMKTCSRPRSAYGSPAISNVAHAGHDHARRVRAVRCDQPRRCYGAPDGEGGQRSCTPLNGRRTPGRPFRPPDCAILRKFTELVRTLPAALGLVVSARFTRGGLIPDSAAMPSRSRAWSSTESTRIKVSTCLAVAPNLRRGPCVCRHGVTRCAAAAAQTRAHFDVIFIKRRDRSLEWRKIGRVHVH